MKDLPSLVRYYGVIDGCCRTDLWASATGRVIKETFLNVEELSALYGKRYLFAL